MIERYTRPEMGRIWSLENQYQAWLEVELAIDEAWYQLSVIPEKDWLALQKNARFDVAGIAALERTTKHDVVAFTRNVSSYLGPESKWIHYGVTSTDVVDTAQGYRLKQANQMIMSDLKKLQAVLKKQALVYQNTLMMGRTHGVHAEPTTLGLKFARWFDEINRHIKRFEVAAAGVEAGKISGAVGTFANVDPQVETLVCQKLGITPQSISTQVLPRDLHAAYIASIALIGTSLENIATEIRSLQRTEIREVSEYFGAGQKGSSAMPHKRNPIGSENITGLARVLRGHMLTAYEDVSLWHERDISHSAAERIILPDSTILIDYMLNRMTNILENVIVNESQMQKNIALSHGLIYSQQVMLRLIEQGLTREEAYDLVQPLTAKSWDQDQSFIELVTQNSEIKRYLSREQLAAIFDPKQHLKQITQIFERVGINDDK